MSNASGETAIPDLVYVSFNSRAAALNRATGEIVWQWKASSGSGYVAMMLDGENLMTSVSGYTYCLDARTGEEKWMNKMAGFGLGVPCLTSLRGTALGQSLLGAASSAASTATNAGTTGAV